MTIIKRFYALLLGLYPAAFYNDFAEEMQEIFGIALDDARRKNRLLRFLVWELSGLCIGILREHSHKRKSKTSHTQATINRARWIARPGSAAYTLLLLFLTTTSQPQTDYQAMSNLISGVLITLLSVGLIIAWYRERAGGIIAVTSAVTIGVIFYQMLLAWPVHPVQAAIGAIIFVLPYALFGGFFIILSMHTHRKNNLLGGHYDHGDRHQRPSQKLRAW